jgi:6-phosphogluconolactonase
MAQPTERCEPPVLISSSMNPDLLIYKNSELLSNAAAEYFTAVAADAVASRGSFIAALSGGSTPKALFSLLAGPTYRGKIDWQAVHLFWGDERLVPADDAGSNYYHVQHILLSQVPVPPAQVHRVRGELPPKQAADDYTAQLRESAPAGRAWPRFDLALMGLGADGHTASLFPGSTAVIEEERPVVVVTADYAGRPAQRVTLTPPVFNSARRILFLVTGKEKATALSAVLRGPKDVQKWPAQSIQPVSGSLTWFADRAAASQLGPL